MLQFIVIFSLLAAASCYPFKTSSSITSIEQTTAENYGVGISLTANHGTISVRHDDGSFEDFGRVDGDDSYIALMRRLSLPESQHLSPPYNDMDEAWKDLPRQVWRWAWKRLGRPASADVAVLSDMIDELVELAASSSHGRPKSAVISYPSAPGLYEEDVIDAAEYLDLQLLQGKHIHQPREMVAAYAGHELGLCRTHMDEERCRKEGFMLPERHVLFVEYTEAALLLQRGILREAIDSAIPDMQQTAWFDVGEYVHSDDDLNDVSRIKAFIVQFLQSASVAPKRMTVIMTGSPAKAGNFNVIMAVRSAVNQVGSEADMLTLRPEYVAARGAAEMAWRSVIAAKRKWTDASFVIQ